MMTTMSLFTQRRRRAILSPARDHGGKMEIGTTYYLLRLTRKGDFGSQRGEPFPLIAGARDDRILAGTKALQVFADRKRALKYLEREIPERTREFIEATGEEVGGFTIDYVNRLEVKAIASELGADCVLIEDANGDFTVEDV